VIAVDKDEFDLPVSHGCLRAGGVDPSNAPAFYPIDFAPGDTLLYAETQTAGRIRIDRGDFSRRINRAPEARRRHAMPDADLHKTAATLRISCQAVSLPFGRLGLGASQAHEPPEIVQRDPHPRYPVLGT
jgi:hypothetical protein